MRVKLFVTERSRNEFCAPPEDIDSQQFANVLTVVVLFLFCSKELIESFCIIDGIFQLSMELFREIQIFWCLIY